MTCLNDLLSVCLKRLLYAATNDKNARYATLVQIKSTFYTQDHMQ